MLALTNCDVIPRALLKFGGDFKTGGIEKIATAICAELLARLSWQNNYLPGNIAGGSAGLREFSLALREHKTRLIEFGRFAAADRKRRGQGKPETFNFLGFTFIRRKTRAGRFLVMRESRTDRMRAKLKEIKGTPRRWKMHEPLPEQGQWLAQILTGWFAYHAAPTNFRALQLFRDQATQLWRRALSRRGQRAVATWDRMRKIANELDCQSPQSFTHGQRTASPSNTRGRSRMREFREYGSARGRSEMGVPTANVFIFDPQASARHRSVKFET